MTVSLPMTSVLSLAATLGAFMALLMAVFLVAVPSRTRTANILLASFLAYTAIDISAWFMADWWNRHPSISAYRPVFAALQMPFFTGFIWLSCYQSRRLRVVELMHVLPAVVVLGFVAADAPMPWRHPMLETQYLIYIGLAVWILWRFHRLLRARSSQSSPTWRWLTLLVVTSLLAHSFYLLRTQLSEHVPIAGLLQSIAAIGVLAITVWIAFQALLRPDLFRGGDRLLASVARTLDDERTAEHQQLTAFMEEHRPYLDPDLSLAGLARQLGIPQKELSSLINQRQGVHFFDFVNRFRVEHSKVLLAETEETVTDILYASGFNTKSSFNTAFRKHAGTTPTAFRRAQEQKRRTTS